VLLNYLRTGELVMPSDTAQRRELEVELDFYQFEHAWPPPFHASLLLGLKEHRDKLIAWRNQAQQAQASGGTSTPAARGPVAARWRLLYRLTRDGAQSAALRARCDSKGETFLVAKSTQGHLFGGYSSTSWTSTAVADAKSFLFTLTNPCRIAPTQYRLSNSGSAAQASHDQLTFGSGADLRFGNPLTSATCSQLLGAGSWGTSTLVGSPHIQVVELEVWGTK